MAKDNRLASVRPYTRPQLRPLTGFRGCSEPTHADAGVGDYRFLSDPFMLTARD